MSTFLGQQGNNPNGWNESSSARSTATSGLADIRFMINPDGTSATTKPHNNLQPFVVVDYIIKA